MTYESMPYAYFLSYVFGRYVFSPLHSKEHTNVAYNELRAAERDNRKKMIRMEWRGTAEAGTHLLNRGNNVQRNAIIALLLTHNLRETRPMKCLISSHQR